MDADLRPDPRTVITGLTWTSDKGGLESRNVDAKEKIYARIHGHYENPGWTLLLQDHIVRPDASGNFDALVSVSDEKSKISLYAVSDFGRVEQGTLEIDVSKDDWDRLSRHSHWLLTAGLGVTSIQYTQTNAPELDELMTTARFALSRTISNNRRWDFAVSGYASVFTLSDNISQDLKYLGLNARLGYTLPQVTDPWRVSIAGGYYFVTTWDNANLGFTNVSGPQIYPSLRYTLKNRNFISGYLKYSPVISGTSVLSLSNHEFAVGGVYGIELANRHILGITTDYASLQLNVAGLQENTHSLTFGFSYSF